MWDPHLSRGNEAENGALSYDDRVCGTKEGVNGLPKRDSVFQRLCINRFLDALLEQPRMEHTEPRAVSCVLDKTLSGEF